jgi:hypothetical protein
LGWAADCYTAGYVCTNLDTQIKGSRPPYFGVDSGAANAYVVTPVAPLGPGLKTGSVVIFIAGASNTTTSTINFGGSGVKTIKKWSAGVLSNLSTGDITAGQIMTLIYDGTYFQIASGSGGGTANFSYAEVPSGSINGSNVTFTLAHTPNPSAGLDCRLNGLGQRVGGSDDFTLATATITYNAAPLTGDTLVCWYPY